METRQHHQSHHQPSLVATASTTTQRDIVSSGVSLTTPTATNHFPGHHDRESTFNFAAEHHAGGQISKHHVSAVQPTAHDEDYQRKAHMASDSHKPVFRWTTDVTVLFEGWTTRTIAGLTAAMLLAALAGAMYELLRNFLSSWDSTPRPLRRLPRWKLYTLRIFRSGMHLLNAAAGYTQMLLAMTFDLRIFTAILLGSSLGFFVLGPYFSRITFKRKRQYEQSANASSVEPSWKVKDRRHNQSDLRSDNDEDKKCSAEDRDLEKSVPLLTLGAHTEQISYKELSQLEETAV